jgi:hypothetical protein
MELYKIRLNENKGKIRAITDWYVYLFSFLYLFKKINKKLTILTSHPRTVKYMKFIKN